MIRGERKIGQKSLGFEIFRLCPHIGCRGNRDMSSSTPPSPTPHILLFQFHAPMPEGGGGRREGGSEGVSSREFPECAA